ncbi:MAG: hypothetical protein ACKPKO_47855 [Candidatus Fonsibacter sp.]
MYRCLHTWFTKSSDVDDGADDDDDDGRQIQPCEATAFEQTPIADVGKPYRPPPNDSKPTTTETTSAGRNPIQIASYHMINI